MDFDETQLKKKNLRTENLYAYTRLHLWVNRQLGKANMCTNNSSHVHRRYHWANISGEYKHDLADWRQLCVSCNILEGVTDSTRLLMSLRARGNQSHARSIVQLWPGGSWLKYPSGVVASQKTGISRTSISNAVTGYAKTAGGYRWQGGV